MPSSDGISNLRPFTGGPDPRRSIGPGRPHKLADPAYVELVATMFINGMTRQQMCDELDIKDVGTITRWKKDPRVKAASDKLLKERIGIIAARTDAEILKRLDEAEHLTIKEILAIRNEFMGGKMRDTLDTVDSDTVNDLQDYLAQNPEDAAALEEMLGRQSSSTPSDPGDES